MMESIRTVAASICLTLLATGIFSMVVPGHSMERMMKFAVSLFFLASLVVPFVQGNLDWTPDWDGGSTALDTAALQSQADDSFLRLAKSRLEAQAQTVLESAGVTPQKLEISIHIEEDGSITISTVKVFLSSRDAGQSEKAAGLLQERLGVSPEIQVEEGIVSWYGR